MGVTHPEEIVEYSVSGVDYVDFLRIFYARPKGSILPVSRTYRFPRVQTDEQRMKANPALQEALNELKAIEAAQSHKQNIAEAMQEQIKRLEEDIALHTEQLKTLIAKIEAK